MPNENNVFAYLFKNDFRMNTRRMITRGWMWGYFAAIAVVLVVVTAVWGGENRFNPRYLLYICFGFPFIAFGISFSILKREWSNGTVGWWLTLPYSRSKLLLAKLAAAAAQAFVLFLIYFFGVLLLELFNVLLHGNAWNEVGEFLTVEGEYLFIVLVISPFMLALGQLAATVARTKLRPLLPLVWIVFAFAGNGFGWLNVNAGDDGRIESIAVFGESAAAWLWLLIPASWLIASILFAGAVRLTRKHLIL